MTLSRRGFLEVSALSATGLMLKNIASPAELYGETLGMDEKTPARASNRALDARLEFSFDYDWQFFRPDQAGSHAGGTQNSGGDPMPADNTPWRRLHCHIPSGWNRETSAAAGTIKVFAGTASGSR